MHLAPEDAPLPFLISPSPPALREPCRNRLNPSVLPGVKSGDAERRENSRPGPRAPPPPLLFQPLPQPFVVAECCRAARERAWAKVVTLRFASSLERRNRGEGKYVGGGKVCRALAPSSTMFVLGAWLRILNLSWVVLSPPSTDSPGHSPPFPNQALLPIPR